MSPETFNRLLSEAMDGSLFRTSDEIIDQIARKEAQVWSTENSLLITEINTRPAMKSIEVLVAGGVADEIVNILTPNAEAWAVQQGCTHVIAEGRRGWVRLLGRRGYKEISATSVKEL